MSLADTIGYIAFGNPISQALLSTAAAIIRSTGLKPKQFDGSNAVAPKLVILPLWELAGRNYNIVRLAGLSGAAAVIMGAYGKYYLALIDDTKDQVEAKAVFDTANRFHFLHTLALMTLPIARKPALTCSLMATGTILFSGTMYYRALTGDKTFVHVATCGGFCLIAAWLSLVV